MKFDSLVSNLLCETKVKKQKLRYKVKFYDYIEGYDFDDSYTISTSKRGAISNVIASQLPFLVKEKKLNFTKEQFNRLRGLIIYKAINEDKAGAFIAKETPLKKTETPLVNSPIKPKDTQMELELGEGFELEKKEGLHGWFSRNHGKGWVNCKKSKPGHIVPCGRKKGSKSGKGYPACRPTLSMCSGSKSKKKSHKAIKWKKKKK